MGELSMGPGKRIMMRTNSVVRRSVFCRRWFVRLVFGVKVVADAREQSYCEWNTLLFRSILPRYLRPGMRVLDMGTGAHALVAILAKKLCGQALVTATDIVPGRIEMARRTAASNGVELDCRVGSLFDGLDERFDLVLFAPPVIPSDVLRDLGYEWRDMPGLGARRCWSSDGGNDGFEVLRPFLRELPDHLAERGHALIAVNPSHCSDPLLRRICAESGLRVRRVHEFRGIVRAYALVADGPSNGGEEKCI